MIKLKTIRTDKNLTTTELASRIGISQSYYSHIENGRRPMNNELAKKIANVLSVDAKTVIDAAKENEENSDRLNSWIGYVRIHQTPFVRAFGYYLKDSKARPKTEEDLKNQTVEFISKNIAASVRAELEENKKVLKSLLSKLEAIIGKKLI